MQDPKHAQRRGIDIENKPSTTQAPAMYKEKGDAVQDSRVIGIKRKT